MAVQFKSQIGIRYLSTAALKWYGDSIALAIAIDSSWHIEAVALDIDSSWHLLTDLDEQFSWNIYNELTPQSSWNILNDVFTDSSWNILTDFDQSSSWNLLAEFEIGSSWDLQGIKRFFPEIDVRANPIAVNFKALLRRELNIKAPKVYNFYNRTEKKYEFRALRHIKRK